MSTSFSSALLLVPTVFLVTLSGLAVAAPLMHQLGLARRAACIVSGDTTANCKPHPEPLFHAANLAGATPDACLYVGDAERTLAAGMRTLVALYGYLGGADHPETWHAHGFIQSPMEVIGHL